MNIKTFWKLLVLVVPLIIDFIENDCNFDPPKKSPKSKKAPSKVENLPQIAP